MKTIMYCHGRGSTGRGSKATIIKTHFEGHRFVGNDYPTDDPVQTLSDKPMPCKLHEMKEFWRYVQILTGDIKIHKPDVIVASSFGGAVLMRVILEGGWSGPTVFLAQAGVKFNVTTDFPEGHRAIFIHGRQDDVVGFEGSAMLAESSADATLVEVTDGHRLKAEQSKQAYLAAIAKLLQD
jgi:hypothetical protein